MPTCSSCGMEIPEGQGSSCSMCYGDPDYGSDGYYRHWLDQQGQEAFEQQEMEREQERNANDNT